VSLRLLHTSDWHLGLSSYKTSREPDHRRFLDWLVQTLADQSVDVLVVAGDVFDTAQPSADALRLYYRFLRLVGGTGVRKVVVVGGNHDSASRLDAASDVLDYLDVHVVGGLKAHPDTWDRCLCPIRDASGRVEAVMLAVPYVHEFRLGVRTTQADVEGVRRTLHQAFTHLYTTLTDRAAARFPGAPIVATGHLTCKGAEEGDYPIEVHHAGHLGPLPGSIFDARIQYVALGHIHRCFPVEDPRVWYCGSPVAFTIREMKPERQVLMVDLSPDPHGQATVTPLKIPTFRSLIQLEGHPRDVARRLKKLTWSGELDPLVYVTLEVEQYSPDAEAKVYEARDTHPVDRRPRIVQIRQEARFATETTADLEEANRPLHTLKPMDVFVTLCNLHGEPVTEDLLRAFSALTSLGDMDYKEALDLELAPPPQTTLLGRPPEAQATTAWRASKKEIRALFEQAIAESQSVEVIYSTRSGGQLTLSLQPSRMAHRGTEPVVVAVDAANHVAVTLVLKRVARARALSSEEGP